MSNANTGEKIKNKKLKLGFKTVDVTKEKEKK